MDNRFRREQNLSQSSHKKHSPHKDSHPEQKEKQDPSSFVQYFLSSYKKIRKHHVLRDTFLL